MQPFLSFPLKFALISFGSYFANRSTNSYFLEQELCPSHHNKLHAEVRKLKVKKKYLHKFVINTIKFVRSYVQNFVKTSIVPLVWAHLCTHRLVY